MNDRQEKAAPGTVLRIDFHEGSIWLQVLEPPDEETRHHETDGKFALLYPLKEGEDAGLCPPVECAGQTWRRPPFILYGVLFWRDVTRAKRVEILGTAALPPESLRMGSRTPTDAVDFKTGAGPWNVSDTDGSRIVTWLSTDLAELPYGIGGYWWDIHDAYRFQGNYNSLQEINERAVRYGQEMERRGESPAEISNPALDDPPYPKVAARNVALRVGDLVEIPTVHGLAYLQVTPWEGSFGRLLRVFDGYWPQCPDSFSPQMFRTKFLICVPYARGLIEDGICRKAGRIALVDDTGKQPVTRGDILLERGWYRTTVIEPKGSKQIQARRNLRNMVGQRFMPEHASLSNSTTGYAPDKLSEWLDLDWRPETDLWVQVALEHNQKKLGHSGLEFIRQAKAWVGAFLSGWTEPAQVREEPVEEPEFEKEAPDKPAPMSEDEFWAIIEKINKIVAEASAGWNFRRGALMTEIYKMSAAEIMAFDDHLHRKMNNAYSWPLWAAAYIIHGGCSDDTFKDFRSCLIFLGRDIYEAALNNANSLTALDDETLKSTRFEGLLYIAPETFEEKTGAELTRAVPDLDEPTGQEWDEDDEAALSALCPQLWERFGV